MRASKKQDHGDARDVEPSKRGFCDECGERLKTFALLRRARFCSQVCRARWWTIARRRGGTVYADLLAWRRFRGRKGTPGQGRIADIAAQVDRWIAEDNAERRAK